MRAQRFTLENAIYLLIFILALGIRMLDLGGYPLQENEASNALQALNLLQAERGEVLSAPDNPQPAYLTLTWLAFQILGDHNAIARLWPALAGALLVFVPFYFRPLIGRSAALLLAILLALDPGLIAASRQADGRMLALSFGLLAFGLAYRLKMSWAGIFLGLALLSGPAVIPGLAGLILALVIGGLPFRIRLRAGVESEVEDDPRPVFPEGYLRTGLIAIGLTIFAAATLFLLYPQGLSSWVAAILAYFKGWLAPSGVPALRLLAALLIYQPLGVIFGLSGALRGWLRADPLARKLGLWFLISLLLTTLYPARQVSDLIWTLAPLLALAALELSPFLAIDRGDKRIPAGFAALVLLLLIIFWLNLVGLGRIAAGSQELFLRLAVMAGILVLVGVSTALIGLGWSWLSAGSGLIWGLCLSLGLYGLANIGDVLQRPADGYQSLWVQFPAAGDADLFMQTVEEISSWNAGRGDGLELLVAVDSAALRWSLRDYPDVEYIPESQAEAFRGQPALLVTRQTQAELSLAADYRGQDFSWWVYPDWPGPLPPNLASWIAFQRAPQRQEQVILWARSDLFPGEILQDAGAIQPSPEIIAPEEFGP